MRNPFSSSRRACAFLLNRRKKRRKQRSSFTSHIGLEPLEARRLFAGDVVNAAISDLQIMPILTGMDGFAAWANTLENTGDLSAPLSLFTDENNDRMSLGSVVDLGDVIAEQLAAPVRVYLQNTAEVDRTTDGLVAVLDALPGISFARGGLAADSFDEFTFEVHFQDQFHTDGVEIDFGSAAADLGLSLQETHGVELSATLDLAFTFGIFIDPDLNVEQAFFVRDTQIEISADVHTSTSTTDLNVGFLEVPGVPLRADMDADVSITRSGL